MTHGAVVSDCGTYRYVLWRSLVAQSTERLNGRLVWVCLNPSVADASADDPTIRKICGFTRRWGFAQPRVVNLYALRSTDPKGLWRHTDPVGPENDRYIREEITACDAIVLAWGANATPERAKTVTRLIDLNTLDLGVPIWHLGLTKNGQPKHPLMLGYDTKRVAT